MAEHFMAKHSLNVLTLKQNFLETFVLFFVGAAEGTGLPGLIRAGKAQCDFSPDFKMVDAEQHVMMLAQACHNG